MNDRMIYACEPSIRLQTAIDIINAEHGSDTASQDLVYCSWPQTFGNSGGPFKHGVVCQVVTKFRMEAWLNIYTNDALVFCNGTVVGLKNIMLSIKYNEVE